jgi:FAD/FMN-containing dehydrogenase
MTATAAVLEDLRGRLPAGALATDRDLLAGFEVDITGRYRGIASALARPRTREEVATVLAACAAAGLPLVPQGGNTGLVGGGVPRDGELVLSLTGLDWVGEVEPATMQLSVGAGATLERAQEAACRAGLELPIDHGARGAATIGGSIATDAGGSLAVGHGTMRQRVAGLEAVLADGAAVCRMGGLLKDNAGYDLPSLLVGSEGTLGVITAARLQLEPGRPRRLAALFGLPGMEVALALLARLHQVAGLETADFFDPACMELVCARQGLEDPLGGGHGVYVLAQFAGEADVTEALAAALESLPAEPAVAIADGLAERERLWAYREPLNESIRELGVAHKMDVAVPVEALPEFERRVRELAAGVSGSSLYLFGHLGDGNVHVNLLGPAPDDEAADEAVLRLAASLGGTISAEHGVGIAKTRFLSLCRSEGEIAAMRALKTSLDPAGVLAPGRVLAAA